MHRDQSEGATWRERCQKVMAVYGDEEAGHGMEDDLLEGFVYEVAEGRLDDPELVAKVIISEILEQERTRWYA